MDERAAHSWPDRWQSFLELGGIAIPFLYAVIVAAMVVAGCEKREPAQATPASQTAPTVEAKVRQQIQIKAMANGSLVLDGKPCTLAELDQRLGELAKVKGEVWWYREDRTSEPAASAKEAFKLVIEKYGLPVGLSSKPDFSDSLDESGVSHPRH